MGDVFEAGVATYEGLRGRKPDTTAIDTCNYNSLATDSRSKYLCDHEGFSFLVKLGICRSSHCIYVDGKSEEGQIVYENTGSK